MDMPQNDLFVVQTNFVFLLQSRLVLQDDESSQIKDYGSDGGGYGGYGSGIDAYPSPAESLSPSPSPEPETPPLSPEPDISPLGSPSLEFEYSPSPSPVDSPAEEPEASPEPDPEPYSFPEEPPSPSPSPDPDLELEAFPEPDPEPYSSPEESPSPSPEPEPELEASPESDPEPYSSPEESPLPEDMDSTPPKAEASSSPSPENPSLDLSTPPLEESPPLDEDWSSDPPEPGDASSPSPEVEPHDIFPALSPSEEPPGIGSENPSSPLEDQRDLSSEPSPEPEPSTSPEDFPPSPSPAEEEEFFPPPPVEEEEELPSPPTEEDLPFPPSDEEEYPYSSPLEEEVPPPRPPPVEEDAPPPPAMAPMEGNFTSPPVDDTEYTEYSPETDSDPDTESPSPSEETDGGPDPFPPPLPLTPSPPASPLPENPEGTVRYKLVFSLYSEAISSGSFTNAEEEMVVSSFQIAATSFGAATPPKVRIRNVASEPSLGTAGSLIKIDALFSRKDEFAALQMADSLITEPSRVFPEPSFGTVMVPKLKMKKVLGPGAWVGIALACSACIGFIAITAVAVSKRRTRQGAGLGLPGRTGTGLWWTPPATYGWLAALAAKFKRPELNKRVPNTTYINIIAQDSWRRDHSLEEGLSLRQIHAAKQRALEQGENTSWRHFSSPMDTSNHNPNAIKPFVSSKRSDILFQNPLAEFEEGEGPAVVAHFEPARSGESAQSSRDEITKGDWLKHAREKAAEKRAIISRRHSPRS